MVETIEEMRKSLAGDPAGKVFLETGFVMGDEPPALTSGMELGGAFTIDARSVNVGQSICPRDDQSNDEILTKQGKDKVNDNMQETRANPSQEAIKPKSPFGSLKQSAMKRISFTKAPLIKSVTKRLSFTKAPKPLSGPETIKKDTEDFDDL